MSRTARALSLAEEHVEGVLIEASLDGVIRRVAGDPETLLGRRAAELRATPLTAITGRTITEGGLQAGSEATWETEWSPSPGQARRLTVSMASVPESDAGPGVFHAVIRATPEVHTIERALHDSEIRFRRVLDAARNGILLADHDGQILVANNALRALLQYDETEIVGISLARIVHPSCIDQLMAMMASRAWSDAAPMNYEVQLLTREGTAVDVEVSLAAIRDEGRATGILIEVRDLTEARRAFEAIRHMSDYDRLTELPNRELFGRHLERALMDAEASGRSVGVVLLDLDRFKLINDTLGHLSGDRLLRAVAERLSDVMPPKHLLARFSGDEYLVLCPDIFGVAAAEATARRVLGSFAHPFVVDGHSLRVTATAGVTVYPAHAQDGETLIRLADAALHEAKAGGGNRYRTGSNNSDDPTRRRFELESDLRLAVEQQELTVYYQPQVDPASGQGAHSRPSCAGRTASTGW